jgi:hypothetical protein
VDQPGKILFAEALHFALKPAIYFLEVVVEEKREVILLPLLRRQLDVAHVEPEIKIFSEPTFCHELLQVSDLGNKKNRVTRYLAGNPAISCLEIRGFPSPAHTGFGFIWKMSKSSGFAALSGEPFLRQSAGQWRHRRGDEPAGVLRACRSPLATAWHRFVGGQSAIK